MIAALFVLALIADPSPSDFLGQSADSSTHQIDSSFEPSPDFPGNIPDSAPAANSITPPALLTPPTTLSNATSAKLPPHILGHGDRIRILVANQTEDATINPEGRILLKGLGVVTLAGQTADQASDSLTARIRALGITADPLAILLLEPAPPAATTTTDSSQKIATRPITPVPSATPDTSLYVSILGDVARPGLYPPGTLIQLLALSGGPNLTARTNAIRIRHSDGSSQTLDLTRISSARHPDPYLTPGSSTFVPSLESERSGLTVLQTLVGVFAAIAGIFLAK